MYHKNYLIRCPSYDIVQIEWQKGAKTKLHDHPQYGCHMICIEGLLQETHNDKITLLTPNQSVFRIGQDKHIIEALENSKSLHIYLPGFYTPKYYN